MEITHGNSIVGMDCPFKSSISLYTYTFWASTLHTETVPPDASSGKCMFHMRTTEGRIALLVHQSLTLLSILNQRLIASFTDIPQNYIFVIVIPFFNNHTQDFQHTTKETIECILVFHCFTACKLQTMCVFTWESRHHKVCQCKGAKLAASGEKGGTGASKVGMGIC